MVSYIIRRLLGIIPLLFGITIISFIIIHLAPGKPTTLEQSLNPKISQEVRLRLEKLYGLDKPIHTQYINWLKKIARFDFGRSFADDRLVVVKILERIPITLAINILSLLFILIIAIPLGIRSAVKENKSFDKIVTVFVFVGYCHNNHSEPVAKQNISIRRSHFFHLI